MNMRLGSSKKVNKKNRQIFWRFFFDSLILQIWDDQNLIWMY